MVLYFFVQWTMPWRHLIYPGDVLWNEEGMRFSWKVMVRQKNGEAVFRAVDRKTGQYWYVSGSEYLKRHQVDEMSITPDMILQFAHFLRDKFKREGRDVAIYVETLTTFNGRAAKQLIDPTVDLARIEESLKFKTWILPEPTDEPQRLTLKKVDP